MIAVGRSGRRGAKIAIIDAHGGIRHLARAELASLFSPGDLVIANDAATLPASLRARTAQAAHRSRSGWQRGFRPAIQPGAIQPGAIQRGSSRSRSAPAIIARRPRIARFRRRFGRATVCYSARSRRPSSAGSVTPGCSGCASRALAPRSSGGSRSTGGQSSTRTSRSPLALADVWTGIAAHPIAFEAPSAGFALEWRTLAAWRQRGIGFATLTHAAGISSTGDAMLDRQLPFDEPYRIPTTTAAAIEQTRSRHGRIVAIGTTVVRALESAANGAGTVRAGDGVASGRIVRDTPLHAVDAILTGVHAPGESHFELLRAFADDAVLVRALASLGEHGYRSHEFGDSMLIDRRFAAR